jgi:hypothetical protein
MSGTLETDEAYDEALDEAFEESSDEAFEEARGRGRPNFRPIPTGPRGSAYRPRGPAPSQYVTEARFAAALKRVEEQHQVQRRALQTLDGRVRSVSAEQGRMTVALRKEIADRKKDVEALRREQQSTRELIALTSLLFPAGSAGAAIAPLVFLLPPDFLSGITGGGNPGSGSGSSSGYLGNNGAVVLIAAAAAAGLFK